MKEYSAPQAEVISFDRGYVMTTTFPSPSGTDSGDYSAGDVDDSGSGSIVINP